MPKITIKTLPLDDSIKIPRVLKRVGDKVTKALNISKEQLVIIWEPLTANYFLFNGQLADAQQQSTHHPLVEITAIRGMPEDTEKRLVHTMADVLAHELSVDFNNICVIINTLAPGKLFVSGKFKQESVATSPAFSLKPGE